MSIRFADVHEGDELPPLELLMTPTRIVAGAIATRDFMPVHHSRDYANQQGAPEIFMNIFSSNAFCSRFLTDWAGPDAMLKRLRVRVGVPALTGTTLTFSGTVTARSTTGGVTDGAEGIVEVAFRAATEHGEHLSGTATLGLPLAGAPS